MKSINLIFNSILFRIEKIETYLKDTTFEKFKEDEFLKDAIKIKFD
jgi:uncharacterized protein with HEPN domain